ncbi:hypothetical protein BFJ72_g1100 [Fusarium proliferatum]|uniref:RING-type domain-containing protein n=1 Tax=Gibberella intermedia TaxID=948311 RepID=A0A365N961_GIBIN|nr:hypothetical protein FPRO05_02068 [Fusarium proliferatum]RKL49642.1 hypothetical protein BFJ72_g1100 [Fusarium proliferatum]
MPNQEHFWPNLKVFAQNNRVANLETLSLECVVCRDSFHYRGLSDDETQPPRRPRVLPCGHILCARCILAYYDTGETRCPICRTELVHDCGHAHTGMPLPLTPGNMDKLPPILSQGGGMPRGCGPCGILGLQRLFERELNNSPYIPEELKGEYLGIGIMLYSSDEYCSREVTGPVLEIEAPTSIKHMISEIVAYAVRSQRRNQVWLEADFSSMKIRALHFKPDILSRVEESPAEQETAPNNEN